MDAACIETTQFATFYNAIYYIKQYIVVLPFPVAFHAHQSFAGFLKRISVKMTDLDLDETYEAKVCAVKCAWQEAQQAVNAQRDTIEGAKVLGVIVWTMCRVHIIR